MITDMNHGADGAGLPLVTRERRLAPGRRAALYTVLAGLALFIGGVAVGGGAVVLYFKRISLAESPSPERIGAMLVASLKREFALTPGESAAIEAGVGGQVAAMEASSQEYGENVRRQFGELCGSICAVLGPERAKKWKEVMRRKFGENASAYVHMTECATDHGADCGCPAEDARPR